MKAVHFPPPFFILYVVSCFIDNSLYRVHHINTFWCVIFTIHKIDNKFKFINSNKKSSSKSINNNRASEQIPLCKNHTNTTNKIKENKNNGNNRFILLLGRQPFHYLIVFLFLILSGLGGGERKRGVWWGGIKWDFCNILGFASERALLLISTL